MKRIITLWVLSAIILVTGCKKENAAPQQTQNTNNPNPNPPDTATAITFVLVKNPGDFTYVELVTDSGQVAATQTAQPMNQWDLCNESQTVFNQEKRTVVYTLRGYDTNLSSVVTFGTFEVDSGGAVNNVYDPPFDGRTIFVTYCPGPKILVTE